MADLKIDYKDDVLDTSANTKRKYNMITNDDGTVSFEDVTEYAQTGDSYGGADVNATNTAVNNIKNGLIGDAFSEATEYAVGDYAIYENELYVFTANKTAGPWNDLAVTLTKVTKELEGLNAKQGFAEVQDITDSFKTSGATFSPDSDGIVQMPLALQSMSSTTYGYIYIHDENGSWANFAGPAAGGSRSLTFPVFKGSTYTITSMAYISVLRCIFARLW